MMSMSVLKTFVFETELGLLVMGKREAVTSFSILVSLSLSYLLTLPLSFEIVKGL